MKWLTAALLLIAAVLAGLLLYRQFSPRAYSGGTALVTPLKVPAIALTDDRGRATTLAASDGRLRLMFFGYVHCPDVCPLTLSSLKQTYAELSPAQRKRLQVQFVTVDPLQDTPQLVRAYLDKFDPAFTGLTGTPGNIDAAAKALFVSNVVQTPDAHGDHAAQAQAEGPQVSAPVAARIHGDEVRVIDPQGRFVRVYNNVEVMNGALRRDLPTLLEQYGKALRSPNPAS